MLTAPQIRRKLGLFEDERPNIPAPKSAGMLNDPETSAYIEAKYPMKSEFNDAWVQRRERNERQNIAPKIAELVPLITGETPAPRVTTGGEGLPVKDTYVAPVVTPTVALPIRQIETLGGVVDEKTGQPPVVAPVAPPQSRTLEEIYPSQPVIPSQPVQPSQPTIPMQPVQPSTPAPVSRVQTAEQELRDNLDKDYSIRKNVPVYNEKGEQIGTQTIRGKDRDKTFNWKDILRSVGLGALQGFGAGGLGGAIGGALAGGIRGSIDRNFDNKMQDQMFTQPRLRQRVADEREAADYALKQRIGNAQATNYENRPAIDADRNAIAQRRVSNQALNSFYRNHPKFDAANPTEAQVRELTALGYKPEDVGSYNREKPIFANWLGSKMVWDNESGTFRDSGLKPNTSETLTEITIRNPLTNEVNTYTTTQAKAAQMAQSAANMGYQVLASNERQTSRQTYDAKKTQQQQEFTLKRDKILAEMRKEEAKLRQAEQDEKEGKKDAAAQKKEAQKALDKILQEFDEVNAAIQQIGN